MQDPKTIIEKTTKYIRNPDVAKFHEQMETNDKLDAIKDALENDKKDRIEKTVIAHGVIIPDVPKIDIPKVDFSETNELIKKLTEEIQKPCQITLKLTLE